MVRGRVGWYTIGQLESLHADLHLHHGTCGGGGGGVRVGGCAWVGWH